MSNTCISDDLLVAAQREFEALVRTGVFRACERAVCYAPDREDRVQEGLAFCWEWYLGQVVLGRQPDTALAVHAARLRTIDRSRRFAGRDRSRWREDVFEAQGRAVELRRLDAIHDGNRDDDDDRRDEDAAVGLARPGIRDPSTNLLSAIDLGAWLEMLASADRDLMELRGAGYGFEEIGKAIGRSTVGAFRRARQLGSELAERAEVTVG